jgi:glycosyltransferase involved in cell wall biosynthesis
MADLNTAAQKGFEKSNLSPGLVPCQRDPLHVAVIVEDLRFPLDEGAKKTSFSLIRSFIKNGAEVSVFTSYSNPLLENVFPLPGNKFLFGSSFARNLRARAPDFILYIPASSGTIGAFLRAAMIKAQSPDTNLALLNLQYRKLPVIARYLNLHRVVNIVFTQSQASTEIFRSLGCKTTLLSGGIDHTIFRPVSAQEKRLLRSKYGFHEAGQIVLHVGHCNRNRNVTTLGRLVRPGLKVILIASTSTVTDADLLIGLRHSGVTVITDFIESIQHYYQMADCYVFPVFRAKSAIDAPLSVLEAMACNLPIVTTPFGALPGMFPSGNGLHYADTEEEIVQMVKQAVLGQDCRTAEMVFPYSWDAVTSTILRTLQEIHDA